MRLRRALPLAVALMLAAAVKAPAQTAPAAGNEPPCFKEFSALRAEAQKRAQAAQAAGARHASPAEGCKLLTNFNDAEAKLLKYMESNSLWCGIPAEAVQQAKVAHNQTIQVRQKICQAAAKGGSGVAARAAEPTLSDVLGTAKIPNAGNIKTGRGSAGTFDTLSGNPLGK